MDDKAFFMMKNCILIVIFLFTFFGLKAQNYYVKDTSQWIVGLNTRFVDFQSTLSLGEKSYQFDIVQQSIGIRAGYKNLVLVAAVANFPLSNLESRPSSTLNCILRFYPKNMYFKIDMSYLSSAHGMFTYVRNFNNSYERDAMFWNVDVQGLYLFKKELIDLQSFFAFRNRQKASGGSWTLNAYAKSTILNGDGEVLTDLGFQDAPSIDLFFNRVGLGIGYLYSLKLLDDLHWVTMLSLANEFVYSDTFGVNGSDAEFDFVTNLRPHAFSCLVYNYGPYYTGIQAEYFPAVVSGVENAYQLEFYSVRLSAGYRW